MMLSGGVFSRTECTQARDLFFTPGSSVEYLKEDELLAAAAASTGAVP